MQQQEHQRGEARLAEVIATLSLATDLGTGVPVQRALRSCLLAVHLGEALGLSEQELIEVYYLALLRWIGCTTDAHLAAADAYHALTELRPHRPVQSPDEAADILRREVRMGQLDGEAVTAVLAAAGHRIKRRRGWPGGLSEREIEVLRLIARGLANREMAQKLVISEGTVHQHVQHIYNKIGVSTRAAATLYAMQHDLLSGALFVEE